MGRWLGLADGEPVAGGETFDEVAHAVLERLLREPRGVLTLLTGEEPPALDGLLDAHPVPSIPTSSSRCTRAASRTIRSCWRPNEPPVRVVLVEDNDTFRETLELLFGLRDEVEVVGSVAIGRRGAARVRASSIRTSC